MSTANANFPQEGQIPASLSTKQVLKRELRKQERLLDLLQEITLAANDAQHSKTLLHQALRTICTYMHWPVGYAYHAPSETASALIPSVSYYAAAPERYASLREATHDASFIPAEGLPGRVFTTGEPAWLTDIHAHPHFIRDTLTDQTSLQVRSACAFPIWANNSVVAVLEFFAEETREPDEDLLVVMETMGLQLGRVFERETSLQALRTSEARYREVLTTMAEGVIFVDAEGMIQTCNPSGAAILGVEPEDLKGLSVLSDQWNMLDAQEQPIPYTDAPVAYTLRTGEPLANAIIGFRRPDASLAWLSVNTRLTQPDSSLDKGVVASFHDITEKVINDQLLQLSRQQLRQLASRIEAVREEERTSLSREVHDVLGQALTGLRMDLSSIERAIPDISEHAQSRFDGMKAAISETVKIVRRMSADLRPGILDDLGIVAALEWETLRFEERADIVCHFEEASLGIAWSPKQATAIFRVFQELLTNVARHAEASEVHVIYTESDDGLELEVRDNGKGIRDEDLKAGHSLGVLGMRERILPWNGTLSFEGKPDQGTTVTVQLPHPTHTLRH